MKDVRFNWGLPQEDSFIMLKKLITSAPVLVLPDDDLPFILDLKPMVQASPLAPYSPSSYMMTMHGSWSCSCPRY
jgi:hypothetical protein